MQWMISHQDARRNLTPGELIFANSMVAEEIALENKKKRLEGNRLGADVANGKAVSVQMDAERDRTTNTREQVAKMSGVGAGTVARYDAIMKTDDEELKKKVQTGEVKIGTAYREIREKETRICKVCGKEKKIIDFFGNDTICKECARKEAEKNVSAPKMQSKSIQTENIKDIYEDVLTAKNAKDQINQDYELSWLNETCTDFISQVNDRLFDLLCVVEKMDKEHIEEVNSVFENFVSNVFDIQEKLNNKMKVEEM